MLNGYFIQRIGKIISEENDMGVYIKHIKMPKSCKRCPFTCEALQFFNGKGRPQSCPLIEIDDDVWENEKYKLIRMTNEARINKAMAERRADGNTIKADK